MQPTLASIKDQSHALVCSVFERSCSYQCGKRMARNALQSHEALCPLRPERCHFGCSMWVQRKDLAAHRDSCAALLGGGGLTRSHVCDGFCLRRCPLGYDIFDHARIRADKQLEKPA